MIIIFRFTFFVIFIAIGCVNTIFAQWVQTNGLAADTIRCFLVNGTSLFAGTDNSGIYLSTNNGDSWTQVSTGLSNNPVYALTILGNNIYAGINGGGVFLSTNNGSSWTGINNGLTSSYIRALVVASNTIFAGANGGPCIFRLARSNNTWTMVFLGFDVSSLTTCPNGNILEGNIDNGIYLGTINGSTWTRVSTGLTNNYIYALTTNGSNVFAGTGEGVFLSANNGSTWTSTGLPSNKVYSFAASGSNLFAGTNGGGVFLSTNNGASWTSVNSGLVSSDIYSLAANATYLFAGTYGGGVWRRPLSEVILPVELISFFSSVSNLITVLTWKTATEVNNYGFEVQRRTVSNSPSSETSWGKIGFVQGNGTSNAPHNYSYKDNVGSAGTYLYRLKQIDNNGVFKYSQETQVIIEVPKVFALNQNYPDPFNPATTISFSLPTKSFISLKVFDLIGREVATIISEEVSAGSHSRIWNAKNIPSGVYLYRLQAGTFTETKKLVLLR